MPLISGQPAAGRRLARDAVPAPRATADRRFWVVALARPRLRGRHHVRRSQLRARWRRLHAALGTAAATLAEGPPAAPHARAGAGTTPRARGRARQAGFASGRG